MNRVARELESILLTSISAIPLYFTAAVSRLPLAMFHLALLILATRIARRREVPSYSPRLVRLLGYLYLVVLPVDALVLSRFDLIQASTHLLFFILLYLILEAPWERNYTKRILVTSLLFVASIATSTHLSVFVFVLIFGFFLFRQLIHVSHAATLDDVGADAPDPPASRPAFFYLLFASSLAVTMFPFLPRMRSPVMKGFSSSFSAASTGLSDSINFNERRSINPDPQVVARVWMNRDVVPFFIPIRLRGAVYDRYSGGRWVASRRSRSTLLESRSGVYQLARPSGIRGRAAIQQVLLNHGRLLLPDGTWALTGVEDVFRDVGQGLYRLHAPDGSTVEYNVELSRETLPLTTGIARLVDYPISPDVGEFARSVVGETREARAAASRIESYLSTTFQYLPDPALIGSPMSVDDFLLREKRGHCEYFAAGMVVMLRSIGVPARIVGGFYGGELNPLTGYFVLRKRDAHAWVEVFDGRNWLTYDPTPPAARPGTNNSGVLRVYASAIGESVEFFWDRYVLTFGTEDQISLLSGAIGFVRAARRSVSGAVGRLAAMVTATRVVILMVALLVASLWTMLFRRKSRSPYEQLIEELLRLGLVVDASMTSEEILEKVLETRPEIVDAVRPVIEAHRLERFSGRPLLSSNAAAARLALRELASVRQ